MKLPYQKVSRPCRLFTALRTAGSMRSRMYRIGSGRPLAIVCGTSKVRSKRCTEPLVEWQSTVRCGFHGWTTRVCKRSISGAPWRM